jgi:hypothetical protein
MEITTNLGLTASTPGTSTFNNWFSPERIDVLEFNDRVSLSIRKPQ